MTLERHKLRRSIPLLDTADADLVANIKRIFVFGRDGESAAFLITKQDHVYAYGKNLSGCLGLGTTEPVTEPRQVTSLNRRKVIEFSAGRSHVLALNTVGQVFACGSNEYGQLALVNCIQCTVPRIVEHLSRDKVTAIACGAYHSLALTSRGAVLAWGFNFWGNLGLGDNEHRNVPTLIACLKRETIVQIACGQHHSVALTRKGQLYAWGHNAYGQLAIGANQHADNDDTKQLKHNLKPNFVNIPTKVTINGDEYLSNIKQVTCGQNHVLAVSQNGTLHGFGQNYYGQLGTGSRENESSPVKIRTDLVFKDIACSPFSNTSVARTKKRNSLVFGKCGSNWLLTPLDAEQPQLELNIFDQSKDNTQIKKERKSKEETFVQINAITPSTAVIKKESKHNILWQIIYLAKKKLFNPK